MKPKHEPPSLGAFLQGYADVLNRQAKRDTENLLPLIPGHVVPCEPIPCKVARWSETQQHGRVPG